MTSPRVPTRPELQRFLYRALSLLRWATLAVLLLLALAWPTAGRAGMPTWALVLLFAGYNLLVEVPRRRLPPARALAWTALLDLPVAALCYALGGEAGGLLFILFILAADSAVVSLPLRGALGYVAGAGAVAAAIEALLLRGVPTAGDLRALGGRLVVLGLVGTGMAILSRRLGLEHAAAREGRDEAGRLEALDRLRADFLMTVSHDLRTPLTAARTALRVVETSAVDRLRPEERALLANGRRNTERLDQLIADLLAFNQLEAGTLRLDPAPLDLRAVVRDALAAVEPLFRDKGQTSTAELPEPLLIEGDPQRLGQVVVNLLANAHRHTPADARITVSGRPADGEVRLTVRDDGPGIPPGEREAIFRRFHRLAPSSDAAEQGTGLGLAIARGLVELHGGRIWAESGPGGGAAFHVALPRYQGGVDG